MAYVTGFSEHLTESEQLEPIRLTHLGQAHFAATGPEGRTCRECEKWYHLGRNSGEPVKVKKPHRYDAGAQRPCKCQHPIANKAERRVPHDALACRFFKQCGNPPAPERKTKGLAEK